VSFRSKRLVFKTFEIDYLETFSHAKKYNYEIYFYIIFYFIIVKNDMDTIQFDVHTIFQYGELTKEPYL